MKKLPQTKTKITSAERAPEPVRETRGDGIYSEIDQRRIIAVQRQHKWLVGFAAKQLLQVGRGCWPKDEDVPTGDSSEGAAK